MRVRILGAAAGGGLPQWNCRCANCLAARDAADGDPQSDVVPRLQSSLAVSADGRHWYLLNASPDVRQQIIACRELAPPASGNRGTALAGVVLTDAEIDHTTGLLLLREGCEMAVYSTATVRRWLTEHNPIRRILSHFAPRAWRTIEPGQTVELQNAAGSPSGLTVRAFEMDRHVPRFVPDRLERAAGSVIGLQIDDAHSGGRMVYAPCVGALNDALRDAADGAGAVFVDGDEGSLAWLESLDAAHRYYVHINNTNPMLRRSSAEHQTVEQAGIRVGQDGDAIEL